MMKRYLNKLMMALAGLVLMGFVACNTVPPKDSILGVAMYAEMLSKDWSEKDWKTYAEAICLGYGNLDDKEKEDAEIIAAMHKFLRIAERKGFGLVVANVYSEAAPAVLMEFVAQKANGDETTDEEYEEENEEEEIDLSPY